MKKLILLALLVFSSVCNAQITAGYLTGFHILTPNLNNQHPFVEVGNNVLVYKNSFDKLSVAGYYKVSAECFVFRAGITTGYKENMTYKGERYKVEMLTEGLTAFLVPSIEIKKGNITYVGAILGNSVNFGLGG